MGASAFIMAETLGMPYREIVIAAIVPALLYYLAIIAQVHLRATAQGLEGISRKNLPAVGEVMKERGLCGGGNVIMYFLSMSISCDQPCIF